MNRPPIRRGLLVVAVVLLVAVAGCSGLSGTATPTADQSETSTDTSANTTATPTPATDTETATPEGGTADSPTPTDEPESDAPDSELEANATGADLDGEELNDATAAAVEDAGSYTYAQNIFSVSETQRGQSRTQITRTTQVDFEAGQGLRVSERAISSPQYNQNGTTTVYTENNTSYRERVTSEGTNYSTQEGEPTGFGGIVPVNTTGFNQNLSFVSDGVVWEENTTTTVDGDTVTRYDLAGVEDTSMFTRGSDARLTDIGGTLYVDEDDVIRQVSIGYSVETDSGTSSTQVQFTLTDIGSTTVEEPEWTSDAEDADSS